MLSKTQLISEIITLTRKCWSEAGCRLAVATTGFWGYSSVWRAAKGPPSSCVLPESCLHSPPCFMARWWSYRRCCCAAAALQLLGIIEIFALKFLSKHIHHCDLQCGCNHKASRQSKCRTPIMPVGLFQFVLSWRKI